MLDQLLIAAGRVFARLHLWAASVVAVSLARSVDKDACLRSSYAFLLARESRWAQRAFVRMWRRDRDRTADDNLLLAYTAWCLGRLRLSELINRRTARLFGGSAEAETARREADFAASILDGSLRDRLAAAVDALLLSRDAEEPILLAPVSGRYLELYRLWSQQVRAHLPGPVLLLAMDQAAAALAGSEPRVETIDLSGWFGFDTTGRIEDYSRRHLWILRVMILRELVWRGHTVLSLDLDAIVLGDVMAMLRGLPAADVVVQRDYSIPVDVARKLGFILCCGFMYLRPTAATRAFLDRYVAQTIAELDDQTAINHLLVEAPLEERIDRSDAMTFRALGMRWVCPSPALVSREVDSGSVVRHFDQKRQSLDVRGIAAAMKLTVPEEK